MRAKANTPAPAGLKEAGAERKPTEGPLGRAAALANDAAHPHPRGLEKHYRQLAHRLGAPLIRELLAAFRRAEVSATGAAEQLGLGRTRFYELYADYLHTTAHSPTTLWTPRTSGGDHAPDWPAGVEPLLRKLLATKPPAPYRCAASEVHRRLGLHIDPATVRRWAIAHQLAPHHDDLVPVNCVRGPFIHVRVLSFRRHLHPRFQDHYCGGNLVGDADEPRGVGENILGTVVLQRGRREEERPTLRGGQQGRRNLPTGAQAETGEVLRHHHQLAEGLRIRGWARFHGAILFIAGSTSSLSAGS